MKDSVILKKVKKLISSGQETFICHAIATATKPRWRKYIDPLEEYKHPLVLWVESMLNGRETYENWVSFEHPEFSIPFSNVGDVRSFCDSQKEGRLAWLDWMIAYCEAEETIGKIEHFTVIHQTYHSEYKFFNDGDDCWYLAYLEYLPLAVVK